jgi:hypothetical protein
MKEAARTSETSVYIQLRTRKYIPEDSELDYACLKQAEMLLLVLNWLEKYEPACLHS